MTDGVDGISTQSDEMPAVLLGNLPHFTDYAIGYLAQYIREDGIISELCFNKFFETLSEYYDAAARIIRSISPDYSEKMLGALRQEDPNGGISELIHTLYDNVNNNPVELYSKMGVLFMAEVGYLSDLVSETHDSTSTHIWLTSFIETCVGCNLAAAKACVMKMDFDKKDILLYQASRFQEIISKDQTSTLISL